MDIQFIWTVTVECDIPGVYQHQRFLDEWRERVYLCKLCTLLQN